MLNQERKMEEVTGPFAKFQTFFAIQTQEGIKKT
jgi:hypothetical protein